MMKELVLVGVAAGVGGIVLGKWGGPVEARLASWHIPPSIGHFGLVGATAAGLYWVGRKVL